MVVYLLHQGSRKKYDTFWTNIALGAVIVHTVAGEQIPSTRPHMKNFSFFPQKTFFSNNILIILYEIGEDEISGCVAIC